VLRSSCELQAISLKYRQAYFSVREMGTESEMANFNSQVERKTKCTNRCKF